MSFLEVMTSTVWSICYWWKNSICHSVVRAYSSNYESTKSIAERKLKCGKNGNELWFHKLWIHLLTANNSANGLSWDSRLLCQVARVFKSHILPVFPFYSIPEISRGEKGSNSIQLSCNPLAEFIWYDSLYFYLNKQSGGKTCWAIPIKR